MQKKKMDAEEQRRRMKKGLKNNTVKNTNPLKNNAERTKRDWSTTPIRE